MPSTRTRIHEQVRTPPYRFQVKGVRFLEKREGRGLILDDMGLGKTYQTICYLKLHPTMRPAVIVCPASLKYNWQNELWHHARIEAEVLEGTRPTIPDGDVWIINYDILHYWWETLAAARPDLLVIDECQRIKNRGAKRSKATLALGKKRPHVIATSGTPITNCPAEFFPILHLIDPVTFPSFTDYAFRFCDPKRGYAGRWDFSGASNIEELHELIKPLMIRRMKAEVLDDLPQKIRTFIPVKISNRKEYERAKAEFIEWYSELKGSRAAKRAKAAEALVRIGQLKQLAAQGKLKTIISWATDYQEDGQGKVAVFGIHKAIIRQLGEVLQPNVTITGATKVPERQKLVEKFQTDPKIPWFLGNLRAAGEGITITAADTALMVELGWTPPEMEQAEDRIYRIGQKASVVNIIYFIAKDTIEEDIVVRLEKKRNIIGKVLDGDVRENVQVQIIEDLVKGKTHEREE